MFPPHPCPDTPPVNWKKKRKWRITPINNSAFKTLLTSITLKCWPSCEKGPKATTEVLCMPRWKSYPQVSTIKSSQIMGLLSTIQCWKPYYICIYLRFKQDRVLTKQITQVPFSWDNSNSKKTLSVKHFDIKSSDKPVLTFPILSSSASNSCSKPNPMIT